jgi:uncharacterized protein YbdZ (MbtH family)
MTEEREDLTIYRVVMNHEEQYSIWPEHRELSLGWRGAGKQGTKKECLDYIKGVWTDMRPLSLRQKMAENGTADPVVDVVDDDSARDADPLIELLSGGNHPVKVMRCKDSAAGFQERLDRKYVHILFTETGTELGVRLGSDPDLSTADFGQATGTVRLTGELTLNYVPVRCIAEVDIATLSGSGRIDPR